jgi:hypothetical protein
LYPFKPLLGGEEEEEKERSLTSRDDASQLKANLGQFSLCLLYHLLTIITNQFRAFAVYFRLFLSLLSPLTIGHWPFCLSLSLSISYVLSYEY